MPNAASAWRLGSSRFTATHALSALASLRLTVVLFALSIFLVFVGTLAQVDHGVWDVVNHAYFRVWFARVDFLAFERLVQMFYPVEWHLTGGFYFPGGKLIGGLLLVNLFAAHAVRFKVAADGSRLRRRLGGHRARRAGHGAGDSQRHERHARKRAVARVLQWAVAIAARHVGRLGVGGRLSVGAQLRPPPRGVVFAAGGRPAARRGSGLAVSSIPTSASTTPDCEFCGNLSKAWPPAASCWPAASWCFASGPASCCCTAASRS